MDYIAALYNQYLSNNPDVLTAVSAKDLGGIILFLFIGFMLGFFAGRVSGSR